MDSRYRFGEIAVSCEGYDYPDDPYVLKGSCGVGVHLALKLHDLYVFKILKVGGLIL